MERFVHASLYALIAVAAWTHGRAHPTHRIIALLFGWELVANMARLVIGPTIDADVPPYEGDMLALYYLDHALMLSFRFALFAACFKHFAGGSLRVPLYAFIFTMSALIILKETTGVSLIPVHHIVTALTAAVCWLLILRAVLAPPERLMVPDGAHAVLLVILAALLVKVCLYYAGVLDDTWSEVRRADLLVHGGIALGYLGVLGARRWHTSES